MSKQYFCTIAEALFTAIPPFPKRKQLELAFPDGIKVSRKDTYYIDGRESGRWEKYISAIKSLLRRGRRVVAIFPTLDHAERFAEAVRRYTPKVTLFAAHLPRARRFRLWERIASGEFDCVVGTRLALFAPLPATDLIILDDESHPGHKEEQHPRYHAREVATARARLESSTLIIGSELSSLTTFAGIRQGAVKHIDLPPRKTPATIIDMGRQRKGALSQIVEEAFRNLRRGILVATRLGEGAATRCLDCGYLFRCPNCDLPLTLHAGGNLRCHHCGHSEPVPSSCPNCHGTQIRPTGGGTERLERDLVDRFPGLRVERLEANQPPPSKWDLLVATVKLLDTELTAPVVAISSLDTILELPDPFATERTAQLLVQLRSRATEQFFIQTRLPDHPVFKVLEDPESFLAEELASRITKRYPPAVTLVRLLLQGPDRVKIASRLTELAARLKEKVSPKAVSVLGPGPAFYEKLKRKYRWHLLVKIHQDDQKLRQELKALLPDDIQIDVNPTDIL